MRKQKFFKSPSISPLGEKKEKMNAICLDIDVDDVEDIILIKELKHRSLSIGEGDGG